jgi:DNA polymerase-3 subunit alpha
VARFAAVGTDIRFGLQAIRNVGHNVVDAIVQAREEKGRFTSFKDFLSKCPAVVCNKRTIESLIKAGAFDGLAESRQGLHRVHEDYIDNFVDIKRQEAIGQDSLFGGFGDDAGESTDFTVLPPIPAVEWDKKTLLGFEREMLGLYVSDHPLFGIEHVLTHHADTSIASLTAEDGKPEGSNVTIAGLITGLSVKRTKKGDLWAIVTVEDLEGAIECLFFPSAYMTVSTMLTHDAVVVVKGRVNRRDDTPSIYASDLLLPDISEGPRGPVVVTIDSNRATTDKIEELKSVLSSHPGSTEVRVRLSQPGRSVLMRLEDAYRVNATESLFGDLKVILGPRCLAG